MKKWFIENSMSIIVNNNPNLTDREKAKLKYGLEGFYLTVTKLFVIFIFAFIFKIVRETALLILIFNGIRFTAFGVHAKRSIDCFISSTLFFVGFPLLCIYLYIPITVKYIISIPIVLLIGIYAPADTQKRPLKVKKKRKIYKIASIIISIIYMTLSIIIKDNLLSNCFIFALIIQIIVILPITYKIFGVEYNNYKKYETI